MRILHTAHTYWPERSGVAEVVRQVSIRLARKGHEVHVATSRGKGLPEAEFIEGVHIHRFGVQGSSVRGISGNSDKYLEAVLRQPWDVLAMHCTQSWTTDLLLPHLPNVEAHKVLVSHGLSAYDWPQYREYYRQLAHAIQDSVVLVALSPLLEETRFARDMGLRPPRIITNGIDLKEWSKSPLDVRRRWGIGASPWLLEVSNHSPVKGHSSFFQLVAKTRKTIPSLRGTIIGNNYPAEAYGLGSIGVKGGCWYKCLLRSAAASRVVLKSNVPRPLTVSALQEADIVIITSSREAMPIVPLEAMGAGTPWISLDVGAIRDYAGGIVVTSIEGMASEAARLLGLTNLRNELGRLGRLRVETNHDWDKIVDQYEDVYRSLNS